MCCLLTVELMFDQRPEKGHTVEDQKKPSGGQPAADDDDGGLLATAGRLAHDIVLAIFAVLRMATPADQTLVFRVLAARFPREPGTERQALCIEALKLCNAEIGRDSARAYETWWRAQPAPHPHPSVAQIRRALADSWDEVKVIAFGDEHGDLLSRRLRRKGDPIPDADIRTSLALFAQESGDDLTQRGYLAWCKAENLKPEGERRFACLPITNAPLLRLGGWARLLGELGLLERRFKRLYPVRRPKGKGSGVQLTPSPVQAEVSDERMLDWLRAAAAELGVDVSRRRYDAWATAHAERALREGRYQVVPRSQTIQQRMGSWARALVLAGLQPPVEALLRERVAHFSDAELHDALWACAREVRGWPSSAAYRHWRQRARRAQAELGQVPRVPSDAVIALRFGCSFAEAVALVLGHNADEQVAA